MMEYFVEVDDLFDIKVYGVMCFVWWDVDVLLRIRFDVLIRELILGVDFVVDWFFVIIAVNEIVGELDGVMFIWMFMFDVICKEVWWMLLCCVVFILSVVLIDVEGVKVFAYFARDVAVVECDGVVCDVDVMVECEDWVMCKFFMLYVVLVLVFNEVKNVFLLGKKIWFAFVEARGEIFRDDATNDDVLMILMFYVCVW